MDEFNIKISPGGKVTFIYTDEMADLLKEGQVTIRRASHVEPDPRGGWTADMSPMGGPKLGPCSLRSIALWWETQWLNEKLFGGEKCQKTEEISSTLGQSSST